MLFFMFGYIFSLKQIVAHFRNWNHKTDKVINHVNDFPRFRLKREFLFSQLAEEFPS